MAINPTSFKPKSSKKKINPLFIMIGVALFLGLAAAFGIWSYLTKTEEKAHKDVDVAPVVVASKEIESGKAIAPDDLKVIEIAAATVPEGATANPNVFHGRIAKGSLQENEVLTERRLVPQGSAAGLPGIIPPGERALTIQVSATTGVAGFISPGSRVDILAIRQKGKGKSSSKVVFQNVLIIAVGDALYDPNMLAGPEAMIVANLTVALPTYEAGKLALASTTSQLQLLLRPFGEREVANVNEATTEDVFGIDILDDDEEITVEPKDSIDIILGNQKTKYNYY